MKIIESRVSHYQALNAAREHDCEYHSGRLVTLCVPANMAARSEKLCFRVECPVCNENLIEFLRRLKRAV